MSTAQPHNNTSSRSLAFCLSLTPGPLVSAQNDSDPNAMGQAIGSLVELAQLADRSGLDSVWLLEDPDGWDAFAMLGALARETERVRLGVGVTNPYYRHPSLIAASGTTLDLLSGGRAFLGLGRGQREWYERALGMPVGNPVHAIDETFDLLRQWWSPESHAKADDDATEFIVQGWERTLRPLQQHLPIYLAAVGPRALAIAARQADGVIFNDLSSREFMARTITSVREQAQAAGRDPDQIAFFARADVTLTDDPEPLYERRKATVAMIHALPGMERLLETNGYDIKRIIADVRRAMRTDEVLAHGGAFSELRRRGDMDVAKQAIPTELMAELVIAGPPETIRARLTDLASAGITHVFLNNVTVSNAGESLPELIETITPMASDTGS